MTRFTRLVTCLIFLGAVLAAGVHAEAASLSLSWNAPTTNADGTPLQDLAGYRVYIGTSVPNCPGGSFHSFPSSTRAPRSGQTVTTSVGQLRGGTRYHVRITAVDNNGNESGCTNAASAVAQADLQVTPTATTSFGSIALNATVDRTFTVSNVGDASISGSASTSAPFSIVSGASFTLAPGASRTVTVRFRPTTSRSFAGNVNFTAGGDTVSRGLTGSTTGAVGSPPPPPPPSVPSPVLSVSKNGSGSGTVTSSPAGISCGATCTRPYATGTRVTLTARAASGSTFAGWSGACSGTGSCIVTMSAARGVTARFNEAPRPPTSAPPPPGGVTATRTKTDSTGATYTVSWNAASGATSYRWGAAFTDRSAPRQGTVSTRSIQLKMPYHSSGRAFGAMVCIVSIGAGGAQSGDYSCAALSVPARPAAS